MTEFLTIKDVAENFQVSDKHIYEEVKRGALQATMIGKAYRIQKSDLDKYVQSRKTKLNQNAKNLAL